MINIGFVEAAHRTCNAWVDIVVAFELDAPPSLADLGKRVDAVAGPEAALGVKVQPHIDPFVLETLDPPVDLLKHERIEVLGVGRVLSEDVWIDPIGILVVQTNEVETKLGQPSRLAPDVIPARPEQGV